MKLVWDPSVWDDYIWWQTEDRKVLKRLNALIEDTVRNGNDGIGKPEVSLSCCLANPSRCFKRASAVGPSRNPRPLGFTVTGIAPSGAVGFGPHPLDVGRNLADSVGERRVVVSVKIGVRFG